MGFKETHNMLDFLPHGFDFLDSFSRQFFIHQLYIQKYKYAEHNVISELIQHKSTTICKINIPLNQYMIKNLPSIIELLQKETSVSVCTPPEPPPSIMKSVLFPRWLYNLPCDSICCQMKVFTFMLNV